MGYPVIPAGVVVPPQLKVGGVFEELLVSEWLGVPYDGAELAGLKDQWQEIFGTRPWEGVPPYGAGPGNGGGSAGDVARGETGKAVAVGLAALLLFLIARK